MWRRFLVAMLLAGVAAFGLLVLYVRSELGGRELCALAEATLREASSEPVRIGRCEVEPLLARVRIHAVEVGPSEKPLVSAAQLVAGLELKALLEGRLRVAGVKLVAPRIDLDLSGFVSESAAPETGNVRGGCLPKLGPLELSSLDLTGGRLRLLLPGQRVLDSEGLELSVRGRGALLEVGARASRSSFATEDWTQQIDRLSLRAGINLDFGHVVVDELELSAPDGNVFLLAEFADVCAPTGTASATVNLALGAVAPSLAEWVPELEGQASLRVSGRINPSGWSLATEGRVEGARAYGVGPLDLNLQASLDGNGIVFQKVSTSLPSGKVQAKGSISFESPYQTEVEAKLDRVVLGELLEKVAVPDLTVHMKASGSAHMKGPLAGPNGPRLAGGVDLAVSEFGVFDDTWRRRQKAENRWVGFDSGHLKGQFVLKNDRLELSAVRATTGGTLVRTDGNVYFSVERGLSLTVDAPRLRLEDLGPFGPTPISAQGTLAGTVEGPYTGLDIRANANMLNVDVMGLELGAMTAFARMDLAEGTLEVPAMRGQKGRSAYSGEGRMWFSEGAPMVATLELPRARLGDVATVARGLVPSLDALTGKLDADFSGTLTADGPAARLNVNAEGAISQVVAWGQRFDRGWIDAQMLDGERIEIHSLHLERGEGEIKASATLAFEDGAFTTSLRSNRLDARLLEPLQQALPGVTGTLQLDLTASGTLDSPQGRAQLNLDNLWQGEQPLASMQLSARLREQRLRFSGTAISPWAPGVTPPEPTAEDPLPRPIGSMHHVLRGELSLEGDQPWSATLSLDVPDLAMLLAPETLGEKMRASARGQLTAKGLLAKPDSSEAQLAFHELRFEHGRTRFINSGPALATFEQGRLVLHQLPLRGSGMELDAHGQRETDGSLALELGGTAELGVLGEFVSGLDEVRGDAELALQVRGTASEPLLLGEARLSSVRVVPAGGLAVFSEGSGSLVFSAEAVSIDSFVGRLNGAEVEASGRVMLDAFAPKEVELSLALEEVPLRVDDLSLRLSGTPSLRGSLDALRLGGEMEVTWLRWTKPLELERTLVQALEFSRRPSTPQVFERRGEFLTLDLGLRLGDVRVENNLVQAQLAGDLRLVGTNRHPGLLGAVTLPDGRAFVRNVEYRLTSGVVNFNDPTRIRPAFDVRADAEVRDYLIHISASGTAQQPRLLLSSEPSLAYADIITLLTLGMTSRDLERTDGQAGVALLLDAAYNAGFLGLNEQIKRLLPENQLLRDASFRVTSAYSELTGSVEPVAQFESKILNDGVKLMGQTALLGGRGSRAQVKYEFDETLGVQVQIDSNDPNTPSGIDFGGDVIFKWEAQ